MPYLAEKRYFRIVKPLKRGGESVRSVSSPGNVYPWWELMEGEFMEDVFPLEAKTLSRISTSIRYHMALHRKPVAIYKFPEGTDEHPFAHFMVGWRTGDTIQPGPIFTSERLMKRAQEKKELKNKAAEKSEKKQEHGREVVS